MFPLNLATAAFHKRCIINVNGIVVSALVYIQVMFDIGLLNWFRIILQTKCTLWILG